MTQNTTNTDNNKKKKHPKQIAAIIGILSLCAPLYCYPYQCSGGQFCHKKLVPYVSFCHSCRSSAALDLHLDVWKADRKAHHCGGYPFPPG